MWNAFTIYAISILLTLSITIRDSDAAGELYFAGYVDSLLAEQKDGGNPRYGIGIAQDVRIADWLRPYTKVEFLFDGTDRNGDAHLLSIRYQIGIELRYRQYFLLAERNAWNPLYNVQAPKGRPGISGDIAHFWQVKGGVRW